MPAFLIRHRQGQQGDVLIQDDTLTLTLDGGWAILHDEHDLVLAVPKDQVASIQRIDEQPEE
ncbi:hypothetical protein ACFC0S_16805 [Streptomyces sp. NPDC056084]|uniref:hypothetical protein n=1 Tax=unclassified Streptomyces TaxID=2593676 RepID=UPI0035D6B429